MYERSAIVLERYFENLLEYRREGNLRDNFYFYCELVEKLEKYQVNYQKEFIAIQDYNETLKKIKTIQLTQEKLYKRSAKLEYNRNLLFNNLDGKIDEIEKCIEKIESDIEKNNKDMAVILHIEASTEICSVALSEDGQVFFERVNKEDRSHAKVLAPFVEEALKNADEQGAKINAVALSCGPGSYTSLRIASSTAKGVCYGRNIPLIAIPTTAIMCVPVLFREDIPEDALLCPMIDARRTEVYATVYDRALGVIKETHAEVVTEESFKELLDRQPVYFFGNGAEKCKEIIKHPNAHFLNEHRNPMAKNMMPLAERAWFDERFEDIAYFEPFYLKNYVAAKPKDLLKS